MLDKKQIRMKLEIFLNSVEREFTDIYIAAVDAAKNKRIKKYIFKPSGKTFWVVLGKEKKEYLVTNWINKGNVIYACSCPDYLFRAMLKTKSKKINRRNFCYHIIARIISELNELKKELGEDFNERFLPTIHELKDDSLKDFLKRFI